MSETSTFNMAADGKCSPLLQLPRELRDQIYTTLFQSTRLSYGERFNLRTNHYTMLYNGKHHIVPAPHSLALLSVCHQLYAETHNMWMKHVLFNFHDARSMLNKLSSLPHLLTRIRHLRLNGYPLLRHLHGYDPAVYPHDSVFRLLPGLCLDSLTIVSHEKEPDEYQALKSLIRHSTGWQQLFYIVPSSVELGNMVNGTYPRTAEVPLFARRHLKSDDCFYTDSLLSVHGVQSGVHVEMYLSNEEDNIASVFDPDNREPYDPPPSDNEPWHMRDFYFAEYNVNPILYRPLLVHVRRDLSLGARPTSIGAAREAKMWSIFENRIWKTRRYDIRTGWGSLPGETRRSPYPVRREWGHPLVEKWDSHGGHDELASIPQVYDRYNDVNDN